MFGFGRKKKESTRQQELEKPGLLKRLRSGLARTRANFTDGLANLVLGHKQIDEELLEELETLLLTADVGVEATRRIIDDLTERVKRKDLSDPQALSKALKEELVTILEQAFSGDARFPDFSCRDFQLCHEEAVTGSLPYRIRFYQRRTT